MIFEIGLAKKLFDTYKTISNLKEHGFNLEYCIHKGIADIPEGTPYIYPAAFYGNIF